MKKFIFALLLAMTSQTAFGAEPRLLGIPQDKILHFSVSAGLNTVGYTLLTGMFGRDQDTKIPCLIMSSAGTILIGFFKEFDDAVNREHLGHKFYIDKGDMTANIAGTIVSAAAIYLIDIHKWGNDDKYTIQANGTGALFVMRFK